MKFDELVKKIKSKGYWRINFKPYKFEDLKPLSKCKELVEACSTHLTGWDYPHVPSSSGDHAGINPGNDYYQAWIDWEEGSHIELWKMFQSGQFIHYFGLIEDWNPGLYQNIWEADRELKSGEALGLIRTVYFITNIYQFLSGLVRRGLYEEGVSIDISLNNTEGRSLIVEDMMRVPFSTEKRTIERVILFSSVHTKKELIEKPKELALDAIVHFFERFSWDPPNIEVIKSDQEKLLSGKIY